MSIRIEEIGSPWDKVKSAAKKVGRAGKVVGKAGGRLGLKVVKSKEAWKLAAIAAGGAFGVPPNVMAEAFDTFTKTGQLPADPKVRAAILRSKPPMTFWERLLDLLGLG